MSDQQWYTNLAGKYLSGKHVHVKFRYGSLDGELNRQGEICLDNRGPAQSAFILKQDDQGHWVPSSKAIVSISLVWDGRYWRKIGLNEVRKNDAIVVNNQLLNVVGLDRDKFLVREQQYPISPLNVTYALRRAGIPGEKGFYTADSGEVFYLAGNNQWWMIADGEVSQLSMIPIDFMPLKSLQI